MNRNIRNYLALTMICALFTTLSVIAIGDMEEPDALSQFEKTDTERRTERQKATDIIVKERAEQELAEREQLERKQAADNLFLSRRKAQLEEATKIEKPITVESLPSSDIGRARFDEKTGEPSEEGAPTEPQRTQSKWSFKDTISKLSFKDLGDRASKKVSQVVDSLTEFFGGDKGKAQVILRNKARNLQDTSRDPELNELIKKLNTKGKQEALNDWMKIRRNTFEKDIEAIQNDATLTEEQKSDEIESKKTEFNNDISKVITDVKGSLKNTEAIFTSSKAGKNRQFEIIDMDTISPIRSLKMQYDTLLKSGDVRITENDFRRVVAKYYANKIDLNDLANTSFREYANQKITNWDEIANPLRNEILKEISTKLQPEKAIEILGLNPNVKDYSSDEINEALYDKMQLDWDNEDLYKIAEFRLQDYFAKQPKPQSGDQIVNQSQTDTQAQFKTALQKLFKEESEARSATTSDEETQLAEMIRTQKAKVAALREQERVTAAQAKSARALENQRAARTKAQEDRNAQKKSARDEYNTSRKAKDAADRLKSQQEQSAKALADQRERQAKENEQRRIKSLRGDAKIRAQEKALKTLNDAQAKTSQTQRALDAAKNDPSNVAQAKENAQKAVRQAVKGRNISPRVDVSTDPKYKAEYDAAYQKALNDLPAIKKLYNQLRVDLTAQVAADKVAENLESYKLVEKRAKDRLASEQKILENLHREQREALQQQEQEEAATLQKQIIDARAKLQEAQKAAADAAWQENILQEVARRKAALKDAQEKLAQEMSEKASTTSAQQEAEFSQLIEARKKDITRIQENIQRLNDEQEKALTNAAKILRARTGLTTGRLQFSMPKEPLVQPEGPGVVSGLGSSTGY